VTPVEPTLDASWVDEAPEKLIGDRTMTATRSTSAWLTSAASN
jgi:hypothetical protein